MKKINRRRWCKLAVLECACVGALHSCKPSSETANRASLITQEDQELESIYWSPEAEARLRALLSK